MSSKRSRPYDEPPSPESSEEEEEEEEEEEQTLIQNPKKPQSDEEEEEEEEEVEEEVEEEEEEEVEEEEEESDTDLMKKSVNNNTKVSQPEPEPESESGSESESEAETEPNYIAKPIVKESPSPKVKNVAKTTSLVEEKLKKAAKATKPSPKQQVGSGGGEDDEDGGEKKALFARVWSFEDELAVLQGMIDFKKVTGKDTLSNSDDFYNFVKQKVKNGKFTKSQVVDKVRRLKKKYMTNVAKSNKGKAVEFSNPHDLKAYKLSEVIWSDTGDNFNATVKISSSNPKISSSNAKSGNDSATIAVVALPASDNENVGKGGGGGARSAKKAKTSDVKHLMEVDVVKKENVGTGKSVGEGEGGVGEKGFAELYPHLMKSFEGECVPKVQVLEGLKSCLGMVDGAVLEEWNKKWKELRVAEMDAYISRLALIKEQASWLANAMKSSKY